MNSPRNLTRRPQAVGLSVGQLSLAELHQEVLRRVRVLQERKTDLLKELERVEAELGAIGDLSSSAAGSAGPAPTSRGAAGARSRRLNKMSLRDLLVRLLDGKAMSTRESAEAALAAGYVTSSRNFVNSVGVAMNGDARFKRDADGKWCLVDGVEIPPDADVEDDTDDEDDDE